MSAEANKPEQEKPASPLILAPQGSKSPAHYIASLPAARQTQFLNELEEKGVIDVLPFLFDFWALPHQSPSGGN